MNLHFTSNGEHRVLSIDNTDSTHAEYLEAVKAAGWIVDDNRLLLTYQI